MDNKSKEKKPTANLRKEAKTVTAMAQIYCKDHHGTEDLCDACRELLEYTTVRVTRCPHGKQKPACKDCHIHCFREPYKTDITKVMRYAGPRMMKHHPLMALQHLLVRFRRGKTSPKKRK